MFFKKKRFEEDHGYTRISRTLRDHQQSLEGRPEGFDDDEYLFEDESEEAVTPLDNLDSLDLLGRNTQPIPPLNETKVEEALPAPPAELMASLPAAPSSPAPGPAPQFSAPARSQPPSRPTPPPLPSVPAMASDVVTLVSKGARWEGNLSSEGDIRVEGSLRGEIQTDGTVFVADHARVAGTIRARNVLIAGEVEGEIFCRERMEVLPGGSAKGQINTNLVVVHEGAFVDSRFKMARGDVSAKAELPGSPVR